MGRCLAMLCALPETVVPHREAASAEGQAYRRLRCLLRHPDGRLSQSARPKTPNPRASSSAPTTFLRFNFEPGHFLAPREPFQASLGEWFEYCVNTAFTAASAPSRPSVWSRRGSRCGHFQSVCPTGLGTRYLPDQGIGIPKPFPDSTLGIP